MLEHGNLLSESEFETMNSQSDKLMEFINGQVFMMASPSWAHQQVSLRLGATFLEYFEDCDCDPVLAPFDIILTKENDEKQWVIPDLAVICDKNGLDTQRYHGVPNLVVEILSKSNQHHDLVTKMNLYARYGVQEYWIVNPFNQTVSIYSLDPETGHYIQDLIALNGNIESRIFSGLLVDVDRLFPKLN